jgi:hypothetical protein
MKWDTNKTNLNNAYIVTVWETSHGWKYANYSAQCLIKNHTFEEETGCRGNSIDPRIRYTAFSQVISWLQCRVAIANGDPEVFCQRHIGCIIQDTQACEELHLLVQCDRALKRWRKHNEKQYLHNAQANGQAHHASTYDSNVEHIRRSLHATNLLGATLHGFHQEESVLAPALGAHETSIPLPLSCRSNYTIHKPTQDGFS